MGARRLSCVENGTLVREGLYDQLRRLAVEDPKEARRIFLEAFGANAEELTEFLARLRRPNEGRLRQVVANAVRTHPEKQRIVGELVEWRESETDEFTRRAIEGALLDVEPAALRPRIAQESNIGTGEVAVYRYVSTRLRHRLRNSMLAAQAQANRLKSLMTPDLGPAVQTIVAKLNDAMVALGRELEATDVDPGYFAQRSIVLTDWLRQMNLRYANQYTPVALEFRGEGRRVLRITANDYLLETIFWNIWVNANQAVATGCEITIDVRANGGNLELLVSDNGSGFPHELKDIVFHQIYSTKTVDRGRGLLEIRDAVERLGGRVELYEAKASEFRIRIRLPLEVE